MPFGPRARVRFIALVLGALMAFAVFRSFRSVPRSMPTATATVIGQIDAVYGRVDHRESGAVEFSRLSGPQTLSDGERLLTAATSEAVITFANGAALRLKPNSQLVSELNSTREGAVRVTLLSGDVEILNLGAPGALQVIREGRDMTSAMETADVTIPPVQQKPSAAKAPVAPHKSIVAVTPVETPTPAPTRTKSAAVSNLSTLSDDEIRRSLRAQSGFFQRCYLAHLGRVGNPDPGTRTVTVGFTIQPSGKVAQAKIVRSDFADSTLNGCVLETVERTSFRPFSAKAVPVLEFPIELN